jgi:hypothetical protein
VIVLVVVLDIVNAAPVIVAIAIPLGINVNMLVIVAWVNRIFVVLIKWQNLGGIHRCGGLSYSYRSK